VGAKHDLRLQTQALQAANKAVLGALAMQQVTDKPDSQTDSKHHIERALLPDGSLNLLPSLTRFHRLVVASPSRHG
jgi:hypothetical protein